MGVPINLQRDGRALSDGTIDQVGQLINQFTGVAAYYFSFMPTLRLFRNGRLLGQYFGFLEARDLKTATKLLAARHALKLVRYNQAELTDTDKEVDGCDSLARQLMRLSRQLQSMMPNAKTSTMPGPLDLLETAGAYCKIYCGVLTSMLCVFCTKKYT